MQVGKCWAVEARFPQFQKIGRAAPGDRRSVSSTANRSLREILILTICMFESCRPPTSPVSVGHVQRGEKCAAPVSEGRFWCLVFDERACCGVSRDRPGDAEALVRTRDAAMRSGADGGAGVAEGTRGRPRIRRLHAPPARGGDEQEPNLLIMTINPDGSSAGSSTSGLRPTYRAKAYGRHLISSVLLGPARRRAAA